MRVSRSRGVPNVEASGERLDLRAEQGRLDVLVNDIWGGETLAEWNTPLWEHDLDGGLVEVQDPGLPPDPTGYR